MMYRPVINDKVIEE